MHLREIYSTNLNEATGETTFGGWIIRYSLEKDEQNEFRAIAYSTRNHKNVLKVTAPSKEQAIEMIKRDIKTEIESKQTQPEGKKKYPVRIDAYFNAAFTNEVFSKQIPTMVKFEKSGDDVLVELANEELFQEFGKELSDIGFRPLRTVNAAQTATTSYNANLSIPLVQKLGLQYHARYILEDMGKNADNNRTFKMVFDSPVYSLSDKVRIKQPCITISASYDR